MRRPSELAGSAGVGLGYHQAPERPTLLTTPAKPSPIGGLLLLPGWLEARQNCPGGDPLEGPLLGTVGGLVRGWLCSRPPCIDPHSLPHPQRASHLHFTKEAGRPQVTLEREIVTPGPIPLPQATWPKASSLMGLGGSRPHHHLLSPRTWSPQTTCRPGRHSSSEVFARP